MIKIGFCRVLLLAASAAQLIRYTKGDQWGPSTEDLSISSERRRAFEIGAWSVAGDVPNQQWFSLAYSQDSSSILACGGYLFCLSTRPFVPGSVYLSKDNGNTWIQMPLDNSYAWTSCGISGDGKVLVASAATAQCSTNSEINMRVYISTNSGEDWTYVNPGADFGAVWSGYDNGPLTAVSQDGKYIWLVDGSNTRNTLAYSSDTGATWTLFNNIKQVGSVAMSTSQNAGKYVLVNDWNNDVAQLSSNFGQSWTKLGSETTGASSCVMSGSGQYMAVASNYFNYNQMQLYVSNNYGQSFFTASFTSSGDWPKTYQAIAMSQSGLIIALSASSNTANSVIFMSYDAATTWSILSAIPPFRATTLVLSGPSEYMMLSNVYLVEPVYVYQTNLTAWPTSWPTGAPTSAPSCIGGKAHGNAGSACFPCPEGYASSPGAACEACDIGTYQNNAESAECKACSYPYSTTSAGTTSKAECTAVCFCVSRGTNEAIFATLSVLFVLALCLLDPHSSGAGGLSIYQRYLIVIGHLAIPVSDVFTDIAYIFNTRFYNSALLVLIFLVFAHPTLFFIRKLVLLEAWPGLFVSYQEWLWLGYSSTGRGDANEGDVIPFPTFNGKRIIPLPHHTNIGVLFVELFLWIGAIAAQLLTLAVFLVCIPAHFVFLIFWLSLGMFLHMSKLLTVNRVWNMWFFVWTRGHPDFWVTYDSSAGYLIDTEELNSALFTQFIFGSLPQVILQTANNTLLDEWDALGIASVIFSGGMCLNSIYRFVYYTTLRQTKVSLRDVPVRTMFIPDIPASAKHLPRQDKQNNHASSETNTPMYAL